MTELVPYVVVLMLGGLAVVLVMSKAMSEKLVAAGLLPKSFLGLLPVIQGAMRVLGAVLVIAGLIKIGTSSGWLNPELMARYGLPVVVILVGLILLLMSPKRS